MLRIFTGAREKVAISLLANVVDLMSFAHLFKAQNATPLISIKTIVLINQWIHLAILQSIWVNLDAPLWAQPIKALQLNNQAYNQDALMLLLMGVQMLLFVLSVLVIFLILQ